MPLAGRNPADLGNVVNKEGSFRAQLTTRDMGGAMQISGPRRGGDKKQAFGDLLAIRSAAADHTTRMGALQAMKREADRLKEEAVTEREADRLKEEAAVAELGGIEPVPKGYRARVQYTDSAGARMVMKGPRRYDDERRARAGR